MKVYGHFRVGSDKDVPYYRHANYCNVTQMVKAALKVGVDANGLTFYIEVEMMIQDVEKIVEIVEEPYDHGFPVVIWAYEKGPLPDKVGADNFILALHTAMLTARIALVPNLDLFGFPSNSIYWTLNHIKQFRTALEQTAKTFFQSHLKSARFLKLRFDFAGTPHS